MFNIEQTEVDPYKAATWYGYLTIHQFSPKAY